jgi:pimeloyl-ACP methyl ester carboxylesterase
MKPSKISLFLSAIFFSYTLFSQSPIDTSWTGSIDITGAKLGITVRFKTETGVTSAKIDIPEQNAIGLELSKVSFNNPKVHFELESNLGQAVFEGIYYVDSISGTFNQSSVKGTFCIIKGEPAIDLKVEEENLPYNAEEVTFTNDGITFAGTLTYPKTDGKHPAVVMITGSGPQERNETIVGFKIFKVIADHLTKNGIAVLRYDDRGVGGTKGKSVNESTTEDFAGDVIAAVEYLKTRDILNPSQIGLMGHSEGGIVAPLAASKTSAIAFIVLMAGTGVNGYEIIKEQSALIMKADKSKDEEIEGYLKMIDAVYDAVKNNKNLEEVKKQIESDIIENFDNIPEKQRKDITDKEKFAKETAGETIAAFNTKWMKYFLQYEPSFSLSKVKCPVLILFGEKDLQVPPKQNEKPMVDALKKGGNTDYKVIIIPNANHLFQEAKTGSPSEYGTLKKEFVPGFLDAVSGWILQRVTIVK